MANDLARWQFATTSASVGNQLGVIETHYQVQPAPGAPATGQGSVDPASG